MCENNYSTIEWISLKACIIIQQNNICAMCKKELRDSEFTLHHIIPRAKNGRTELENLIGLCDKCHDISVFNYTKPEHIDFKRAWALSNLQLLPAKENLIKHNKLTRPFQPALQI